VTARQLPADGGPKRAATPPIEGPWLWLRAEALASQFGGAALTIVDRRLLSEENERWLANSLHLADPAGIYDDQRLIRSVQQYREP